MRMPGFFVIRVASTSESQYQELRSDDKIQQVQQVRHYHHRLRATLKKDEKVLVIASRELVAAEAHHHKTCYRAYTREYIRPDGSAVNLDDAEQAYADVNQDAYVHILQKF